MPIASSATSGITKLSDAINSEDSNIAATSKAVKTAYDRGSTGITNAAAAQSRADAAYTLAASKTSNTGTVTNIVAGTGLDGGTITTTGTISLADNYGDTKNPYASKKKLYVLSAPSNANGVPGFRALTADYITDGTFSTNRIPTLPTSKIENFESNVVAAINNNHALIKADSLVLDKIEIGGVTYTASVSGSSIVLTPV